VAETGRVALRDKAGSARTYAAAMPDNIRRVDELIRGVRRITAYDLCSILFIGKVRVMAIFQSLAVSRSVLVWGCEC
jgi:hypothetical protein